MQGVDRVRRVAELVRRELSSLIVRDFADYGIGIVSITAVDMTRELRKAKVYVTAFDDGQDEAEIFGIVTLGKDTSRGSCEDEVRMVLRVVQCGLMSN